MWKNTRSQYFITRRTCGKILEAIITILEANITILEANITTLEANITIL